MSVICTTCGKPILSISEAENMAGRNLEDYCAGHLPGYSCIVDPFCNSPFLFMLDQVSLDAIRAIVREEIARTKEVTS